MKLQNIKLRLFTIEQTIKSVFRKIKQNTLLIISSHYVVYVIFNKN